MWGGALKPLPLLPLGWATSCGSSIGISSETSYLPNPPTRLGGLVPSNPQTGLVRLAKLDSGGNAAVDSRVSLPSSSVS